MRALPLLLIAACAGDDPASGGAPSTTDTGPAYAGRPDCAPGVEPGSDDRLVRWPYLQLPAPGEMTVAWGGPADAGAGTLEWTVDGETWQTLDGEPTSVRINDSDEAEPVTMTLFSARITGLGPGGAACYRVTLDGEEVAGGLSLQTPPSPDEVDAPLRFLVIGDFGAGTEDQYEVRDAMLPYIDDAHVLLTTGDNAYGDGDWDELHELVFGVNEQLMAQVPTLPTSGNHDYKTQSAQPYLDNFFLPENALREADHERYWSLDWGGVHLVGLDTEDPAYVMSAETDDDQGDWLEQDLASHDRPWTIAMWHKPAYSGHPTRGPDPWALLQFVPKLEAAGTQLVLQGHDHFYERYNPIRGNEASTTTDGGITYFVTAGGGQGMYEIGPATHQARIEDKHHFLWGEVAGCTMHIQAIDKTGAVFDEVTLDRCDG